MGVYPKQIKIGSIGVKNILNLELFQRMKQISPKNQAQVLPVAFIVESNEKQYMESSGAMIPTVLLFVGRARSGWSEFGRSC